MKEHLHNNPFEMEQRNNELDRFHRKNYSNEMLRLPNRVDLSSKKNVLSKFINE